jgi:DNA anti-recombination protein RmuC
MSELDLTGLDSEQHPDAGPAAEPSGYGAVGDRVAGILRAAEEAAEQIQAEARAEAENLRRRAHEEAEARIEELSLSASRTRDEAEDEARALVTEAERHAASIVTEAQQAAQDLEEQAHARHAQIREETRSLEERRRTAVEALRGLSVELQDLLVDNTPRRKEPDDTLVDVLDSRRRSTT